MPSTIRLSTHHRIQTAPRQVKFPSRRKTIRAPNSPLRSLRQQSTLTQLDYVKMPDSSHPQIDSTSSDEDDGEDEEYKNARPAKKQRMGGSTKRRRAARGWKQSTLTQKWDTLPHVEIKDSDESDASISMLQAEDLESDTEERSTTRHSEASSSTKNSMPIMPDLCSDLAGPKTSIQKSVHFSENVPGANRSANTRELSRSPLKECSTNLRQQKHPRLSSSSKGEVGILHPGLSEASLYDKNPSQITPDAPLASTPKESKHTDSRKLRRKDIIPDSEEEMDFGDSPMAQNDQELVPPHPDHTSQPQGSSRSAKRKLQRTTTVQESEDEDLELQDNDMPFVLSQMSRQRSANLRETQTTSELRVSSAAEDANEVKECSDEFMADDENDTMTYECTQVYLQNTYDPVTAALDRDAARFGKTETQLSALENNTGRDDSFHGQDKINDQENMRKDKDEVVPSSQPEEGASATPTANIVNNNTEVIAAGAASSGHGSQHSTVPSSQPDKPSMGPPNTFENPNGIALDNEQTAVVKIEEYSQPRELDNPLRPSQISTQSMLSCTHSAIDPLLASPEDSPRVLRQTLPSSPFPEPPEYRVWRVARNETQVVSLTDFSLPPPLPLSSARRSSPSLEP